MILLSDKQDAHIRVTDFSAGDAWRSLDSALDNIAFSKESAIAAVAGRSSCLANRSSSVAQATITCGAPLRQIHSPRSSQSVVQDSLVQEPNSPSLSIMNATGGFWGPVTATLDWCEANYQFSNYIAEMANTISNLFTVGTACLGAYLIRRESLPNRYFWGYVGLGIVGLGSFAFHGTLLYSAQLADELPMVLSSSWSCFIVYDTEPTFVWTERSYAIMTACILLNTIFAVAYAFYRNPVFHQAVFASLMLLLVYRVEVLIRCPTAIRPKLPKDVVTRLRRTFGLGLGTFILGFLIWNLDNIYCIDITRWKRSVGWPVAFLLEGHAWWHILTAAGTYYLFVGTQYLTLCIKESPSRTKLQYAGGWLPYAQRLSKGKGKPL